MYMEFASVLGWRPRGVVCPRARTQCTSYNYVVYSTLNNRSLSKILYSTKLIIAGIMRGWEKAVYTQGIYNRWIYHVIKFHRARLASHWMTHQLSWITEIQTTKAAFCYSMSSVWFALCINGLQSHTANITSHKTYSGAIQQTSQ